MMMCRLHTWLPLQSLWNDFTLRENIRALFVFWHLSWMRADSIICIQGKWPCRLFFLQTIVCYPGGKKKKSSFGLHTQNTVLISSCFDFVSCLWCVQGSQDTKWEGLPALFCIFYKFIYPIRVSVFWNWKILLLKHNYSLEYFVLLMTEKSELLHQSLLVDQLLVDWIWTVYLKMFGLLFK